MPCERFLVFTSIRIPEVDIAVSASAGEYFPIGAERHAINPICMSGGGYFGCAGVGIPEAEGPVPTPTSECFSIGAERYTYDTVCMSYEYVRELASVHLPEADGIVAASACECLSIWAECHASHPQGMSFKYSLALTGVCIPEVDILPTPTGECFSIGAERYAIDRGRSFECLLVRASMHVPQVGRIFKSPTGERFSIGAERYTENSSYISSERFFVSTRVFIPEVNGLARITSACEYLSIWAERYT